jgi:hypothetical protein
MDQIKGITVGINSDSWWKAIGLRNLEDLVVQWLRASASNPKGVSSIFESFSIPDKHG